MDVIKLLKGRYTNQRKTKEEQIKFILRKCFKFLKKKMQLNELTMTPLEMEKVFYREYFGESMAGDVEEMIPFRNGSSLKTMNVQYLKKIFQSPKFYEGYLQYLGKIWLLIELGNREVRRDLGRGERGEDLEHGQTGHEAVADQRN